MTTEPPGNPIVWPLLGVGHGTCRELGDAAIGRRTVLDMLIAAVTLGERSWTRLASFIAIEWDESQVEASLKFIDQHLRCVSADGVIDVRSIETIVAASGRREVFGAWTSASDPRVPLPLSAIIRRNWEYVMRLGSQRDHNVNLRAIFARVPIRDDQEVLMRHFGSALKITNGATRISVDSVLFETCLTVAGLKRVMTDPPSFIALVTTGCRKIEEGEDDPVDVHFAPRARLQTTETRKTEPRPASPSAEELARRRRERDDKERIEATKAAAEAQRQEQARLAAEEAEAAEAERARQIAEAFRAGKLEVKPAETPAAQPVPEPPPRVVEHTQPPPEPHVVSGTVELSAPEVMVYEMAHAAMRLLIAEFGYSFPRLTTHLLYKIVALVLPRNGSGGNVIERMAEKGAFTRLTAARKSKPSVFALNTCAYTKSPYTKKQPKAVTEADIHALVRNEYAGEAGAQRLRFDTAFIVNGPSEYELPATLDVPPKDEVAPEVQETAQAPPCAEVAEPVAPLPERPVQTVDMDALTQLIDARIDERVQRAIAAREEEIRADERKRVMKECVREALREVLPEELIRLVDDAIDAVIDSRRSA